MAGYASIHYKTLLKRGVYCTLGKEIQYPMVHISMRLDPDAKEIPFREFDTRVLDTIPEKYEATWEKLTREIAYKIEQTFRDRRPISIKVVFGEDEAFSAAFTWRRA
jgi:hypothetical protein